ncbi:MAG: hypothetical protein LAT75_03480 [Candidatus Cyclonatronum sp.]|uniref:hypothetical protein n=1 Tax=Cyclonatronum sp. TaxID=3024185 RepID=UPI0025C1A7C7|nr:hypothetical protein [Cyclonatronum sp.]MCH8485898.1 hypothetical protein [Cyclonatronum sp.]
MHRRRAAASRFRNKAVCLGFGGGYSSAGSFMRSTAAPNEALCSYGAAAGVLPFELPVSTSPDTPKKCRDSDE